MALCIFLQVVPQMLGQSVLAVRRWFENIAELRRLFGWRVREVKQWVVPEDLPVEANDVNSLAMLRNPTRCIDDLRAHDVIVLKQEDGRAFDLGDGDDIEEERSLRGAFETVRVPETLLLRHSGD